MKMMLKILALPMAIVIVAGCSSGASDGAINYKPFNAPPISTKLKDKYLKGINDTRSVGRKCGDHGYYRPASPLVWNDNLYRSSYEHSWDLLKSNTLSHNGSGTSSDWSARVLRLSVGSTPQDRGENNGYGRSVGENIYVAKGGHLDIEDAIEWWLQSDDHCRNLMSRDYKAIGIAKVNGNSDSRWDVYWTGNFGI